MKLKSIQIRHFRSFVSRREDPSSVVNLGEHINYFVGPNNCGKSNLLRAVSLALNDWDGVQYDRLRDCPSQVDWAYTIITLVFTANARIQVEKTLLKYLHLYEEKAGPRSTYASDGEVHLRVQYFNERKVTFSIRSRPNATGDPELLEKCISQFRKCVRFVYLKSGEGVAEFMRNTLYEILETVLKEHLKESFARAEKAREEFMYILVTNLLNEMGVHLISELQKVVQEIKWVGVEPRVALLNEMLADADIRLKDTASTPLLDKGTGIRGVLLVALLRYLCENSKRSVVLAVEEPESFLHPEAQVGVKLALESLADCIDTTLLVTTHSPIILSRRPEAQITALTKDAEGRTLIQDPVRGDESHAPAIASLYGKTLLPYILESIRPFESSSDRILFVEGYTDKFYLEHAAQVSGNLSLLDGFEVRSSSGAHAAALEAMLLKQLADGQAKIAILFDYDEEGKAARDLLKNRYRWGNKRDKEFVMLYRDFRATDGSVPVEAEDMYPAAVLEEFLSEVGEQFLQEKKQYTDGTFHYGLSQGAKRDFMRYVTSHVKVRQVSTWLEILRKVRGSFALE